MAGSAHSNYDTISQRGIPKGFKRHGTDLSLAMPADHFRRGGRQIKKEIPSVDRYEDPDEGTAFDLPDPNESNTALPVVDPSMMTVLVEIADSIPDEEPQIMQELHAHAKRVLDRTLSDDIRARSSLWLAAASLKLYSQLP